MVLYLNTFKSVIGEAPLGRDSSKRSPAAPGTDIDKII